MNGADEGIVARPRACVQQHNDGQEEKRAQGKGHSPEASGRYGGGCGRRCGRRPGRSRASLRGLLPVSPPTDFSSKQWKKVSTRRCLECIEQGHCAASEGYRRHNTVATSTSGVDTTAMINAGASDIEIMEALGLVQAGATSSSGPGRVSGMWVSPNSGIEVVKSEVVNDGGLMDGGVINTIRFG